MSTNFSSLRSTITRQARLFRPGVITRTPFRSIATIKSFPSPLQRSAAARSGLRDDFRSFSHCATVRDKAIATPSSEPALPKEQQPAYEMTFTCKKCETRSTHRISKQGYHKGTVLVQCPGCKNRHLISDHLKIFSDQKVTLEDILKEKGQLLKKGELSAEGDVEFWEDGSQTVRKTEQATDP